MQLKFGWKGIAWGLALATQVGALGGAGPAAGEAIDLPGAQAAPAESPGVAVRYLTNRRALGDDPQSPDYGGDRGTPRVGVCEVQFAPIPLVGELAASLPFYVPSEQRRVRVAESQSPAAFWEGLVAAARGTASGSAVLFVHGYSNGFERGCRMAAEVQRALEGQATVLLFSWPSSGNPLEYSRDQAAVEWSVPLLAETVEALGVLLGPGRTRILAHSLGSRGAIFALEWLEGSVAAPAVGELVLLAPDFDAQSFRSHLPRLARLAGGISLYASASDTPLKVSEQLHGAPRLGQGGALRTVVAGLETVDVSHAGGYPIMGHEYFYRHPRVLGDLARLLGTGERAGHRPQLTVRVQGGLPYWEILGWSAGP